jgi:hypothetical protein
MSAERILLFAAMLVCHAAVAADSAAPQLVEVRVGFDGRYKLGCWTAFELTFAGGTGLSMVDRVAFVVPDGDGVPVRYVSAKARPREEGRSTAVVYARFGRMDGETKVECRNAFGQTVAVMKIAAADSGGSPVLPPPLAPDDRLIVCVGRLSTLDEVAATLDPVRGRLVVATLDDPNQLPDDRRGFDGVDAVVVAADDAKTYAALVESPQADVLQNWLELGGRAWLAVHEATADAFSLAANHHLGLWRGDVGPSVALPRTAALERFAGAEAGQSISAAELRRSPLMVPRLDPEFAVVDAAEGDLPLIARRAVGLGTVALTTFHPEHPLLASWPGRPIVVRKVLERLGALSEHDAASADGRSTAGAAASGSAASNWGYDDLAGQLRSALDQYAGVQVASFFTLATLVIGYLALAGPLDYWLVHRVLRRPEMTWITFPAIVVTAGIAAYLAAAHWKGSEVRVTRADVIDCDAVTGNVRARSWAGVFSPAGRTYDVHFAAPLDRFGTFLESAATTTWFGLPGRGLGGMHVRGGAASGPAYTFAGDAGLAGVPIAVWSSKMFTGAFAAKTGGQWMHAPLVEDADGRLRGAVRNPFDVDLAEAVLCYGSRAYEVGELKSRASRELASLDVRDLQSVLQGWQVVMSANKNPISVGTPHDPGSRDVAEILRKMMFYAAAGGRDHANLENRFQPQLDLSGLLNLRRAVLVGRVDPAAVGKLQLMTADGATVVTEERGTAFVRLVIPVMSTDH